MLVQNSIKKLRITLRFYRIVLFVGVFFSFFLSYTLFDLSGFRRIYVVSLSFNLDDQIKHATPIELQTPIFKVID